jgi:hypothetical protein
MSNPESAASGLPRESNNLSEWLIHCYTDPESASVPDIEQARRLRIARTAMAGIEELIAAAEITDVTLTFTVPGSEGAEEVEFNFSA